MSSQLTQLRDGLYGMEYREPDQRRVEPANRKTYDIKQMWQRHHEIVNMAATGMKQVEIAAVLNIDPQTVSNVLNGVLGKEKLAELREARDGDTKLRLEQVRILADKAMATYYEILENEKGEATLRDRKDVADTIILELSGMRVPTKVQSASVVLSGEDMRGFIERGKAAMRESGMIVDVTPEPSAHCALGEATIVNGTSNE
jgi:DNA-binding CsgD family transcriptional regulator